MAHDENLDQKNVYNSPEIVCLGDAVELTAGDDGVLSDGKPKPKGYKDVEAEPSTLSTTDPGATRVDTAGDEI